ncbi:reverse transcriptase domain-containing protein [Tanacetum coccineum]|uniref:Reverse transcriptase domain-containing protein n=1 Tax=Tanacetum coccineum TaxID=301880 RepID=A0ABQ5B642_9ASTR
MISMMLRLMFPPWRGVTTNPRILEGINPTKRFAKGKETTHQSSAIQDDRREAISKVVHVTMVEVHNGKQFAEGTFPVFGKKLETLQAFTSVYHPQANGQEEAWVDELTQILWAHRTTPKSSNGETLFSLVYGSEAVIPIEISVETKRVQDFDSKENEKRRREDLDVLEERREIAAIKEAHYKQKLEGYYNKNVKPSTFKLGTYVL